MRNETATGESSLRGVPCVDRERKVNLSLSWLIGHSSSVGAVKVENGRRRAVAPRAYGQSFEREVDREDALEGSSAG